MNWKTNILKIDLTASVVLPSEFTLYDKCIISIEDLNDEHVNQVEESKKLAQLKIIYNLENKTDMKSIINDLLESQRYDKNCSECNWFEYGEVNTF